MAKFIRRKEADTEQHDDTVQDSTTLLDQGLEDRFFKALLTYERLASLVNGQLTPANFSTTIKAELFKLIIDHHNQFAALPSQETLDFEVVQRLGKHQASGIRRYLTKLGGIPAPEWDWLLHRLDQWVKTLQLRKAMYEAELDLKEGRLELAQQKVVGAIRHGGVMQVAGRNDLDLTVDEIREVVEGRNEYCCPTRIYALDDVIHGLYRKELTVIMAPLNVGKSWCTTHFAVSAAMSARYVLLITGEMSANKYKSRIIQNVSGLSTPRGLDDFERQVELWGEDWAEKELVRVKTLLNASAGAQYLSNLKRLGGVISVKEYSSGTCKLSDIEREVDIFDVAFGHPPDVVIMDGLLDMSEASAEESGKRRHSLANLARGMRRIAQEGDLSFVTTHQANREGLNADLVDAYHTGEALAIAQVADTGISLNQTRAEYQLGKMRVYLFRARNKRKQALVEIWQTLDIGQFAQVSRLIPPEELEQMEEEAASSPADRQRERIRQRLKTRRG